VETADMHAAAQETFPLAKARAHEIVALEQWAVTGAKTANNLSRGIA
jgi:hypothetical protein